MEALAMCRKKLDRYHLHSIRAVATEAYRRGKNNYILVERAKKELNIDIENKQLAPVEKSLFQDAQFIGKEFKKDAGIVANQTVSAINWQNGSLDSIADSK